MLSNLTCNALKVSRSDHSFFHLHVMKCVSKCLVEHLKQEKAYKALYMRQLEKVHKHFDLVSLELLNEQNMDIQMFV